MQLELGKIIYIFGILAFRPFQRISICEFLWKFDVLDVLTFLEKDEEDEVISGNNLRLIRGSARPNSNPVSRGSRPLTACQRV